MNKVNLDLLKSSYKYDLPADLIADSHVKIGTFPGFYF